MSDPFLWNPPEPAKIKGMVHVMAAVWDPERGWLVSRTSITHRETMVEREDLPEIMAREAGSMARALRHKWLEDHA